MIDNQIQHGTFVTADNVIFNVWAPFARSAGVVLVDKNQTLQLDSTEQGFHTITIPRSDAGNRYFFSN